MEKCPTCDEYVFGSSVLNHVCKPVFEVNVPGYHDDDDWQTVRAYSGRGAAEEFADQYDCESAEYAIVSGREYDFRIKVRSPGQTDYKVFSVYGEAVPTYYAIEVSRETAGETDG